MEQQQDSERNDTLLYDDLMRALDVNQRLIRSVEHARTDNPSQVPRLIEDLTNSNRELSEGLERWLAHVKQVAASE